MMATWYPPTKHAVVLPDGSQLVSWHARLIDAEESRIPVSVALSDQGLRIETATRSGEYVPADVALRLLATATSERLGIVWEVDRVHDLPPRIFGEVPDSDTQEGGSVQWFDYGDGIQMTSVQDFSAFTPDLLLGLLKGRFLLEDLLHG